MSDFKNIEQTRAANVVMESVDLENRTAEFVISTEAKDSYETVFTFDGWDQGLSRYSKNPVVTFNHLDHSGDPDMVIGTSEVRFENQEVIAKVTFESAELNPVADKVMRKVANGTLRGASIRALVNDGRFGDQARGEDPQTLYFTDQELIAWSIVTVPSNPDAVARNHTALSSFERPKIIEDRTASKETMSPFEAQSIINKNRNSK